MLKDCIHLFKFKNKTAFSRPLSELLLRFLVRNPDWLGVDFLVPVPLNRARLQERGFNQSEILARNLARRLDIKVCSNNLKRKGMVSSQTKSGREKRSQNVALAFYLDRGEIFRNKKVLLIDDVFTTGSTVNACAKVLREAGAKDILVLTVARSWLVKKQLTNSVIYI